MGGVLQYEDFSANCNHMPGSDKVLRVNGTVAFRTDGYSAELREHEKSGPIGINPNILYLDLVIGEPDGGVPEVITPVPVSFELPDPPFEYEEVQFVVVGSDDEGPERVYVEHTQ